jgi:excisionase family DNA binding protein
MAQQRKIVPRRTARSDKREFRSIPEVAELLGVGINQAYQAVARGDIRAITIGGQKRVSDQEIARLRCGDQPAA